MHDHYTKLWSSILDSTIWHEDRNMVLLWIVILAKKDKDHIVRTPIPTLADKAKITIVECEEYLARLQAPDKYSRSKEHGGRRLKAVEGGFLVLNGAKYQEHLRQEQRKLAVARANRDYRERKKKQ